MLENAVKNGLQILYTNYYSLFSLNKSSLYIIIPYLEHNRTGSDVWYIGLTNEDKTSEKYSLKFMWENSEESTPKCVTDGFCYNSQCICKEPNMGKLCSVNQFYIEPNIQFEVKFDSGN